MLHRNDFRCLHLEDRRSAAEAELAGVLLILAADVRFGQQHGSDLRPKERRDGS